MGRTELTSLGAAIGEIRVQRRIGRVTRLEHGMLWLSGLTDCGVLGDRVIIERGDGSTLPGELVAMEDRTATIMPDGLISGVALGDRVVLLGAAQLAPDASWIGRIIDPDGKPLDGKPLLPGASRRPLQAAPPDPTQRRALGPRLETGIPSFNTFLPIARGQRVGLFSGSGVGKSSLLGHLARGIDADVVVIGLVGERGREVRLFAEEVLGVEGMTRAVIVAATSDRPALTRRRCAWACMAVAEHFRDQGLHVLLLTDSVTRFAEAHRDVALAAGESPSLQGFPASLPQRIMELVERAGPGQAGQGDITAIFTVLVVGSDMEGAVADTLRGTLDGHVVLDRGIAERGRFPAIDLLRSVSRSLPAAAADSENRLIGHARQVLSTYENAALMLQSGLYSPGSDPAIDEAVSCWAALDNFLATLGPESVSDSFERLAACLQDSGRVANTSADTVKRLKNGSTPPTGRPAEQV